jgi:hypothetical protein
VELVDKDGLAMPSPEAFVLSGRETNIDAIPNQLRRVFGHEA